MTVPTQNQPSPAKSHHPGGLMRGHRQKPQYANPVSGFGFPPQGDEIDLPSLGPPSAYAYVQTTQTHTHIFTPSGGRTGVASMAPISPTTDRRQYNQSRIMELQDDDETLEHQQLADEQQQHYGDNNQEANHRQPMAPRTRGGFGKSSFGPGKSGNPFATARKRIVATQPSAPAHHPTKVPRPSQRFPDRFERDQNDGSQNERTHGLTDLSSNRSLNLNAETNQGFAHQSRPPSRAPSRALPVMNGRVNHSHSPVFIEEGPEEAMEEEDRGDSFPFRVPISSGQPPQQTQDQNSYKPDRGDLNVWSSRQPELLPSQTGSRLSDDTRNRTPIPAAVAVPVKRKYDNPEDDPTRVATFDDLVVPSVLNITTSKPSSDTLKGDQGHFSAVKFGNPFLPLSTISLTKLWDDAREKSMQKTTDGLDHDFVKTAAAFQDEVENLKAYVGKATDALQKLKEEATSAIETKKEKTSKYEGAREGYTKTFKFPSVA